MSTKTLHSGSSSTRSIASRRPRRGERILLALPVRAVAWTCSYSSWRKLSSGWSILFYIPLLFTQHLVPVPLGPCSCVSAAFIQPPSLLAHHFQSCCVSAKQVCFHSTAASFRSSVSPVPTLQSNTSTVASLAAICSPSFASIHWLPCAHSHFLSLSLSRHPIATSAKIR